MEQNNLPTTNNLLDVRQAFDSKQLIENLKNSIIEGKVNPLEGFTVLKRMAKVAEEVLKDEQIKESALKEFDKYLAEAKGGKSILLHSAQICKTATYTWYDFKGCNHEVLNELYAIKQVVEESIKLIEEELKLLIPKDNPGAIPGLGIQNTTKDIIYSTIPRLVWDNYGGLGTVNAPRKVQTIGLKYMKI